MHIKVLTASHDGGWHLTIFKHAASTPQKTFYLIKRQINTIIRPVHGWFVLQGFLMLVCHKRKMKLFSSVALSKISNCSVKQQIVPISKNLKYSEGLGEKMQHRSTYKAKSAKSVKQHSHRDIKCMLFVGGNIIAKLDASLQRSTDTQRT